MKMKLMSVFLTAASAIFAQEQMPTTRELPLEVKKSLVDSQTNSNWFGYMRLGVSDSRPNEMTSVQPGLGLGCRFGLPVGALDLSASYMGNDVKAEKSYFYTLPRVSYLMYLSPKKEQSLYAGAGLAFGGLKTNDAQKFDGIIPSVSVGYEMNRQQNWHSFFQIDVSQPALATSLEKGKSFMEVASASLGPIAECSVGFGY
jgi:hypothetical protein